MTEARIAKTPRSCDWCGIDISDMRGAAKYCSKLHKKNAASKRHRERNPDYYKDLYATEPRRQYMIEYGERNRNRINVYAQKYRVENLDYYKQKSREWFKENPEKHRAYQANRRSRKVDNPGSLKVPPLEISRLLRRQQCTYCLKFTKDLDIDHVVPLIRGGRHAVGNLTPSCPTCNSIKRANLIIELKRKGVKFPWSTPIRSEECLQL